MASRGLRKTYFFPHLKACERRNFDFCVFLRMCSGSGETGLYKLNEGIGRRHAGPHTPAGPSTQFQEHTKIKVSPLTDPQMEIKLCFS